MDGFAHFGTETGGSERLRVYPVEPHGPRIVHLLRQRQRLVMPFNPMTRRRAPGTPLEQLEQVRRNRPPIRRDGHDNTKPLELLQPPLRPFRRYRVASRRFELVHVLSGSGDFGNVTIDRTNDGFWFRRERHPIAPPEFLGGPRVERHMVGVPRRRLNDRVTRAAEFVRQTLVRDAPCDDVGAVGPIGFERLPGPNDVVAGRVAGDGRVNLLDDIAAGSPLTKGLLPPGRQSPLGPRYPFREPHGLEVLKTANKQGLVDCGFGAEPSHPNAVTVDAPCELAVERREPVLGELLAERPADGELVAGPELLGCDLPGAPAHAARDVRAVQAHLAPIAVDAADDDVRVGMIRVVMVDRRPLQVAADVPFDARHQAPHERGEVELTGVLGRDDESELVVLAGAGPLERLRRDRTVGVVEDPLRAIGLHSVALDVSKVERRRLGASCRQASDVRLDNDAPGASAVPGASFRRVRAG